MKSLTLSDVELSDAHAKMLACKIDKELERIFWRRRDKIREMQSFSKRLNAEDSKSKKPHLTKRLARLQKLAAPGHITVQLYTADGENYTLPIQPSFIESLDEEGSPHVSATTIADVKWKISETCGIVSTSQILFCQETEAEFEDDQTIEECGLSDGQNMYVVVDTDRTYWHQHSEIVKRYKGAIVHVVRLMRSREFMEQQESPKLRPRLIGFLRNCRKALACMAEHQATHKARSMKDLLAVERFLKEVVTPIFKATFVCSSAP